MALVMQTDALFWDLLVFDGIDDVDVEAVTAAFDKEVPGDLDVHLVCDNYATHKTPAIKKWLLAHPRFHLHFTPTGSSWLNLVERWFAELTNKQIRRGPTSGRRPQTKSSNASPAI